MKNSHQQRGGILRGISTPENSPSQNPSYQKQRSFRRLKSDSENIPPADPNTVSESPLPSSSPAKPPTTAKVKCPLPPRPPPQSLKRKLSSEAVLETGYSLASDSGVQVIVRMRPPNNEEEEGEPIVQKISENSLSILDHVFTFDSIADTESTQQDIFELVGKPLVENCLAGFNSSIFAYGQTGSGKTYTMWGPSHALAEDSSSSNSQKGLTPRVFELLFARINEEQVTHADKELNYQCRCSFLEIYNEQITDLLDPNQRNLQIREDVKTGVYVDNLTEEYVCTIKDITKLLIKGLANRRIGATSINAESSRSHSVFTCVVESRCKSMADGLSSLRTSRINLVDLAGSERQKHTGAAGERLKEAGNINRSLSQLGNLINILAEVSQSGKQRHIPYRDSRLTFLLQESLGGNAKLAMICAISPSQSCKSETFSTLRFAQRAKAIKNKAVVNEVTQDDVNVLREVIRQLKEELLRMKSNGNSAEGSGGYSTGWNARRSLNLLKMSLSHSRALPAVEDDNDEEMEIDEDDIERLCIQVGLQASACDENINNVEKLPNQMESQPQAYEESKDSCGRMSDGGDTEIQPHELKMNDISASAYCSDEVDINMEECQSEGAALDKLDKHDVTMDGCGQTDLNAQLCSNSDMQKFQFEVGNDAKCDDQNTKIPCTDEAKPADEPQGKTSACIDSNSTDEATMDKTSRCKHSDSFAGDAPNKTVAEASHNSPTCSPTSIVPSCLSIIPCEVQPVLKSPTSSISPRVNNLNSRKSLRTSSMSSVSKKDTSENVNLDLNLSFRQSPRGSSDVLSNQITKNTLASTENLAASLHRGLQIMDSHQQTSILRRSSLRFSFKPMELKSFLPADKVDVGVQAYFQEAEVLEDSSVFVCSYCKSRTQLECKDSIDRTDLQIIPVDDGLQSSDKSKIQVPKAVEKVLAGAIRREMALEDICAKQATEITQLNRLILQYKHERECNAMIEQTREEKIRRLEGLMDGVLPAEDFMEDELISLTHEHNLLKEKYEYHPEILRTKIELKRVREELDSYRNFFDMGERDVLMEEIQHLRSQLQCYIDSSPMSTWKRGPLLQLTYPSEPISSTLCTIPESTEESAEVTLEEERRKWTEAESRWISLTEELRLELEASRSLAAKQKQELDSEKKCSEELKEALRMAMQGHARVLDQYADLQEKHIALLSRHRKIRDGIEDVKQAAAKAGVRGAESKFINSLAAEISALKVEREKERRYLRDENKALQSQLRDTAEAVQAAGELLVRLKEAEEAIAVAQNRAEIAEKEAEKAHNKIDKLKKKHQKEIGTLNQLLAESRLPKEALRPAYDDARPKFDEAGESLSTNQRWREEFEPFRGGDSEFSRIAEPSSWFAGYDRCNI